MVGHPIDAVVVPGLPVSKTSFQQEMRQYVREFGTAANFRTYDLSNTPNALISDVMFRYDSTDFTTADDGVNCVLDLSGRRFKKVATGGGGSGTAIFTASAVAGTNTITCNTNGMPAPSSVPSFILVQFANAPNAAATIAFDGGSAIACKRPRGDDFDANNTVDMLEYYLLRVTNTEARIITPW